MTNIREEGEGPVATNNTGGGAVAGLGTGAADQKEPGVNKKKKLRDITITTTPLRRMVPNGLDRQTRLGY